ncbi:MAG: hypothetical protein ACTHKT_10865 [Solirubrobacterales bacterium]
MASLDEALRTAELRAREAEATRTELEVRKLAGEVARQPLEERLLEVQIQEGRAEITRRRMEARSLDSARYRSNAYIVVFLLLIVFILALALVDPRLLDVMGRALPWAPR